MKSTGQTKRMNFCLWFKKTSKDTFTPTHPMTAAFLKHGMTGVRETHLTALEMEYLQSIAENHGLIINIE